MGTWLGRVVAASVLIGAIGMAPVVADDTTASQKKAAASSASQHGLVKWQEWTPDLFVRAKNQNKPVVLDLQAIWCHWCHVMDAKTYSDPQIAELLNTKFIPVQVDQDSRPDLSNRYEQYGWPATVFFKPSGGEIEIRSGFIKPDEMLALLQSIIRNPNKVRTAADRGPAKFASEGTLSDALRKELNTRHVDGYDDEHGGWGFDQKFLDWDTVEYAMDRAKGGDQLSRKRAETTLDLQRKLIDPVWGGVYQYSTNSDWNHPHFEKIMQMQAEDLRTYAIAYGLWHRQADLKSAEQIANYLHNFLRSPDGAFYTSQDADLVQGQHSGEYFALDDAGRRKLGMPRIDQHLYARENGWAINALAELYMVTGNTSYLGEATRAADWIIAHRAIAGGGFNHGGADKAGPFLGDTLSMGRTFLNLYTATGDRKWLNQSEQCANFIEKHFKVAQFGKGAGYATADLTKNAMQTPRPLLDENVMLARYANLLYRYVGKDSYKDMAKEAMRYLATPEIALSRHVLVAGILLADMELAEDPAHITVIGGKSDPGAQALFQAAIKCPSPYKRIEWWDPKEGPLPNPDVQYPAMKEAAAFLCLEGRCSPPVYKPDAVIALFETNSDKKEGAKNE